MSKIIFGDKERQQVYIYNYYFWQNMLIGTLRLFGGPIMIILGIWFYFTAQTDPFFYAAILIGYGVYYSLRPFLFIYFKREKLDIGVFEVEISQKGISTINDLGSQSVDFTSLKKIKKFKKWYALYYSNKSILFLPENQLNAEECEILNKRII